MALVNPNIAMSVKPLEVQFRNPMAEAAQVMNVQQAQMQMEKLRQTDEAIERIRQAAVKNGGPGDLNEIAQAFLQSPDLGHQQLGLKIRQQQSEKADFERTARALGYTDLFPAAPGAAAPAAAPMASAQPGALGSGTFGITPAPATNALAPAPTAPANQLAPVPPAAPVTNALVSQEKTPDQLRREIMLFGRSNDPSAKNMVDILKNQLTEALKTTTVSPGQQVYRGGKVVYERAPTPSEFERLLDASNLTDAEKINLRRQRATKEATHAPSAQQNVFAYTPASVEAQKQFIQQATEERKSLRNAPDVLTNTAKARALIPGAKGFMGAGGEPMLKTASFLNNRLGFTIDTKGVADASELRTRLFDGIMDNLKRLDSQPSQEQQRVMQEALGTLGTDPNALPRILDKIDETVRARVMRYNEDVTEAEGRGVKFPFKPQIKLPEAPPGGGTPAAPAAAVKPPAGIDAALWNVMTPQERALWQK